jgi:hypothetical protein
MNPDFVHSSKLTSTFNACAFYMEIFCENKKGIFRPNIFAFCFEEPLPVQ